MEYDNDTGSERHRSTDERMERSVEGRPGHAAGPDDDIDDPSSTASLRPPSDIKDINNTPTTSPERFGTRRGGSDPSQGTSFGAGGAGGGNDMSPGYLDDSAGGERKRKMSGEALDVVVVGGGVTCSLVAYWCYVDVFGVGVELARCWLDIMWNATWHGTKLLGCVCLCLQCMHPTHIHAVLNVA